MRKANLLTALWVFCFVAAVRSDLTGQDQPGGESAGTPDGATVDGATIDERVGEEVSPVDAEGALLSDDPQDPTSEDSEVFDGEGFFGESDDTEDDEPADASTKMPWLRIPMSGGQKKKSGTAPNRGGLDRVLGIFQGGGEKDEPQDQGADEDSGRVSELKRMATASFRRDRISEAIRLINDLITMKPYESDYHFTLGLCYRKERKYKEALKKYQDVLDLGGPKALIGLLKSEVYAHEGDREKVYEMLKEAAIGGRNIIADVQNLPGLQGFTEDTDFIKLALQLERFEVQRGRRHDPFTNPFPKTVSVVDDTLTVPDDPNAPLSKEDQAELLRDSRRLSERIQFYIKLQDEDKAMTAYIQLRGLVEKQQRITVPKIEKDFRRVVAQLPEIEIQISGIRLRYYYNQAQEKLKGMREVFEDGEYARVEIIHVELEALTREMKTANTQYVSVANEILGRSTRWLSRARVRLDFEARKPEIQGIIIAGDSKMTILDERIVKQGESLQGFRVVRIESNRVTFRYKGEEIPMVFRRY